MLYDTSEVDKIINSPKLTEFMTPRVNLMETMDLVIMMYQCRFVNHDKCAALMGDIDNVGVDAYVYGKSLYLPLSFDVNLITALKN